MLFHSLMFILLLWKSFGEDSPACPASCYCDDRGEYVSCVGDGLLNFPENLPDSTIRLELRNYAIAELQQGDLLQLSAIEELHLQQSSVVSLAEDTFVSSPRLEKLDLSRNLLSNLNRSSFTYLVSLKHLDLSSNKIEFCEESFEPLANLEQLNMKDNLLSQLTTRTFIGLHKIQYLNLDSNNISSIEVGTFQYLTNLARLIISSNPLTTLSRLDFFGSRLQYIDMSQSGLGRIPQTLTKFVRDLRLAGNELSRIGAGDLESYPYLGLLVLDDNCITDIENDALGRLEYLVRLWLNGNCLTKIPPNLPPSLLALYLEENKLTSLPSYGFRGLVHLEQLFLQRNEISELHPCAFCDLINLKSLDLQANRIEDLNSGVFDNLTHLETLDLSQNNLKWVDVLCFRALSSLTTLQMSRVHTQVAMDEAIFDPLNKLRVLEVYDSSILVQTILNSTRMMHGLRNVQEMNLMHNYITRLRPDFPSFFPSLKILKLSGNLWMCDSEIQWLSNWIKQSNVQFYSSYNIRCAAPASVQFKPLMMITDRDIKHTDKKLMDLSTVNPKSTLLTPASDKTTFTSISQPNDNNRSLISITSSPPTRDVEPLNDKVDTSFNDTSLLPDVKTGTEPSLDSSSHESIVTRTLQLQNISYEISNILSTSTEITGVEDSALLNSFTSKQLRPKKQGTKRISPIQQDLLNSQNNRQDKSIAETTEYWYSSVSDIITNTESVYTSTTPPDAIHETIPSSDESISTASASKFIPSSKEPQQMPGIFNATAFARTSSMNFSTSHSKIEKITQAYYLGLVILASVILFTIVFSVAAFGAFRVIRRPYHPVKRSSISYYPQTDEVSIVTLTEGTIGLRAGTHRGLGNKLYYIMEDGKMVNDFESSHGPDPQLQELLPTTVESSRLY